MLVVVVRVLRGGRRRPPIAVAQMLNTGGESAWSDRACTECRVASTPTSPPTPSHPIPFPRLTQQELQSSRRGRPSHDGQLLLLLLLRLCPFPVTSPAQPSPAQLPWAWLPPPLQWAGLSPLGRHPGPTRRPRPSRLRRRCAVLPGSLLGGKPVGAQSLPPLEGPD